MNQGQKGNGEYSELVGTAHLCKYEFEQKKKNKKFQLLSTMFKNKNAKKVRIVRSPVNRRVVRFRRESPQRPTDNTSLVGDDKPMVPRLRREAIRDQAETQCNFVYYDVLPDVEAYEKNYECLENCGDIYKAFNKNDDFLEKMGKNETYFEVVKVEDRGTDTCALEEFKMKEDKLTEPMIPGDSEMFSWEETKDKLVKELQNRDDVIKRSMEEGHFLLEDIEKVQNHFLCNEKLPEVLKTQLNNKQKTPIDFLHLSRICLIELGKQHLNATKKIEVELQQVKTELKVEKKENDEKSGKIKVLERKLEVQSRKTNQENEDLKNIEAKIKSYENAIESGKKMMKDTEKYSKGKIGKLEGELLAEKQASAQLKEELKENNQLVSQLKNSIEKLKSNLEASKQQVKDIQCSYKSKIAKIEADHSNKMTILCENQTLVNKQLSQVLDQSSKYANQIQEIKKEHTTLQAKNKSISEKLANTERDLTKSLERCGEAERKLSRETQEVMALRNQLERLERALEEELMSVDGDTWCQIMYQQDQLILEDLRAHLQEKEDSLEVLRAQGDCSLNDFEKVQKELQQRREHFNELKYIFLDFERKRDIIVRDQREVYQKMGLQSRKSMSRDRFFKNLIDECQIKTEKIEELQKKITIADKLVEENRKISEAQLKAMQMEMKYTAEKLYEFENQIRLKEMQLQEIIRGFELEKKNKTTAEEAVHTYKILLEDSKKENSDLRKKLNYYGDMEENKVTILRVTEELNHETQKRKDAEKKLKTIEKDLISMKKQINSKDDSITSRSEDNSTSNSKEVEQLKTKVQELIENKKYIERILMESQRRKEVLQRDHEELCNKMRQAVYVMVQAKGTQESLELKLDQRKHIIHKLEKSQAETEVRLDSLKDVLHKMKQNIEELHQDREDLKNKLKNHMHCNAERNVQQELKMLQRDKSVAEEQNAREKDMLMSRLRDNELTIKEQHSHLRDFQDQLNDLSAQLKEAKAQVITERHKHTQQLLTLQADKKKLELYIEGTQKKFVNNAKPQLTYDIVTSETLLSSPFTTSDSYGPPIRDHVKNYYRK